MDRVVGANGKLWRLAASKDYAIRCEYDRQGNGRYLYQCVRLMVDDLPRAVVHLGFDSQLYPKQLALISFIKIPRSKAVCR
jgi:hypothetical protein